MKRQSYRRRRSHNRKRSNKRYGGANYTRNIVAEYMVRFRDSPEHEQDRIIEAALDYMRHRINNKYRRILDKLSEDININRDKLLHFLNILRLLIENDIPEEELISTLDRLFR